eukprot:6195617-Pleurochrysis_carterae.AAC.1
MCMYGVWPWDSKYRLASDMQLRLTLNERHPWSLADLGKIWVHSRESETRFGVLAKQILEQDLGKTKTRSVPGPSCIRRPRSGNVTRLYIKALRVCSQARPARRFPAPSRARVRG